MAEPPDRQRQQPPGTDYLSPKPGEHLPEKTVSPKAHARLQAAAGGIAATKAVIQHQGNQVPALKATNMNSRWRLQAMRDDRCWEYTTNESRMLAMQNQEAEVAAKAELANGGNCGEHAWVAYHYLRLHAKGEPLQYSAKSGLDHAFVIVGDVSSDKDNEMAVSDPWPNNPTACLWEDHFAFTPDRKQIANYQSQVADGKSFKAAIAAGLKLTDYGKAMIKRAETDEETKKQTDASQENHFWDHDDAASTKYDYKPETTTPQAGAQGGQAARTPTP